MCAQGVCSDPRKEPSATFWQDPSLFNDNKNIYTLINFNENNNIYSTNNSILCTNNMNYYTKILFITLTIIIFLRLILLIIKKILREQIIIVLRSILFIRPKQ
jgi:hypothetical protein